ncbi:GLPGLI family protein [Chryseobacterium gotjawalense]|uniref:GLPGLI family protein n=1 Tax=Chryseobacterium gotjawalense TaxID=3042315 RepID=A0ABY8RHC8_9FLAO|nr:GLPGLI family protein [Chryseobacterium sp. wdc7]WHF52462.1 GLPGLI family protein [Chryseobacterium sp. wdc7]
MKKIIILLLLSFNFCYSQHLKVEYNFVNNVSYKTNATEGFDKRIAEINKKPEKQILYFANGNSFYRNFPDQVIVNEKSRAEVDKKNTKIEIEKFRKEDLKIFKEKGSDHYFQFKSFNGEDFYQKLKPIFSTINYLNDIEYVDNYKCKLVEVTTDRGQVIKVWYTEDIPVSTGPFVYGMFPGLVLKVQSDNFIIYATKISNEAKLSEVESINKKLDVYEGSSFENKMNEIKSKEANPTKIRKEIHL